MGTTSVKQVGSNFLAGAALELIIFPTGERL